MKPVGGAQLTATPNPVAAGSGLGKTTITWSTGSGQAGQIYASYNGGPEKLFVEGTKGTIVAPWIQSGGKHVFRLYEGKAHRKSLAMLQVTRPGGAAVATLSKPMISATPNPVPPKSNPGKTTITWNTGNGQAGQIYASYNGGPEKLFTEGTKGSIVAPWIQKTGTHVFRLYEGKDHKKPVATVNVSQSKT